MTKKFLSENTELMKEWDWEANEGLNPNEITCGSHKKVWWKCSRCEHKWQTVIKDRGLSHHGCPACSGKIVVVGKNDLLTIRPDIASQWHPTKNGDLKLENITYGYGKKVWWKCNKCGYEWQSTPNNRSRKKNNKCPCCEGKVCIYGKNDLSTTNPDLAKEWHPIKNGELRAEDVTKGSGKRVWWKCPIGHEYQAEIANRSNGTNCPICNSGRRTSFPEQALFYYIHQIYQSAINNYKAKFLGQMELDIYIPEINIAIEYDGDPWHGSGIKGKQKRDEKKYAICKQKNIQLIRVRENIEGWYTDVADYIFGLDNKNKVRNLDRLIAEVIHHITFGNMSRLYILQVVDTERDRFNILNALNLVKKKNSFGDNFPELLKEWHPTKNENFTPYMFGIHSKEKMWWQCLNCGKEYQSAFEHRARGHGCPDCGRKKISQALKLSVHQINIETGEIIKTYDSVREAAEYTKIMPSNISMVCTGQRKSAGGYGWRYVNGFMGCKNKKSKSVYMISVDTNEILKEFNSTRDAAREVDVYEGSIRKVCARNRKSAHGYIWRYADDEETENMKKKK